MPNDKYLPLKKFVMREGGVRLGGQWRFRDQLVEWAVESWPDETDRDRLEQTLRARLAIKTREKYGSIIAAFLVPVLVNVVVRLVVAWWISRSANRTAMKRWADDAKASKG